MDVFFCLVGLGGRFEGGFGYVFFHVGIEAGSWFIANGAFGLFV